MHIPGYLAAVLIGISLGLIGGGGSILTVPVLVYLFHVNPLLATSYSLFTVGITSLVGAVKNYRRGWVHLRTAWLFGSTSIITVIAVRRWLLPLVPDMLVHNAYLTLTKDAAIMLLFACLMILSSFSMIRKPVSKAHGQVQGTAHGRLLVYGLLIGAVTGVLGAGGGFLLIPALVFLVKLPVKTAIGTSLLIIAMNSLIGFAGDAGMYRIDWPLLLLVSGLAVGGILIGTKLAGRVDERRLKKGFGWFVLAMGAWIILSRILKM